MPGALRSGLLGEPNYRRLFFGRTISLVGDGIAPVAIAFAVLDLTGSATDLGIVLAARSLVITALVLVGGVFADRVSPRIAMLRADFTRMLVMAAMAALLISGAAVIWQLALLYAIEGAASAFFNPASDAIIPQGVGPADLPRANGMLNLSKSAGRVAVLAPQPLHVNRGRQAIHHGPASTDHDAVGAMRAAQHERRDRVARA